MTHQGVAALQKELHKLMTEVRPAVIEEIDRARRFGDLSENAEYQAAKDQQAFIENRIHKLQEILSCVEIIEVEKLSGSKKVLFGAFVTLHDEDEDKTLTYQIVGVHEADLEARKLSIVSALSRALIGKEVGETIELITPRGEKHYSIRQISFSDELSAKTFSEEPAVK